MLKRIGIMSAGWNDEYQQGILSGIIESCKKYNYTTLSFVSNNINQTLVVQNLCSYNIYNLLNTKCIDGIILLINSIYYAETIQQILSQFENVSIPVICIDHEYHGMISVGTDNYASTRMMAEHLFDGDERKRFACIAGMEFNPENEMRVQAFRDVIAERLGFFDEHYFFQGNFQEDSGYAAAEFWHTSEKEFPDAVFACNDKMAVAFLKRCIELGYRVPEDVKIVGYDNNITGRNAQVPLSSIQCPLEEIGRKAVDIIKNLFEGNEVRSKELIPGIPHFRASSGVYDNKIASPNDTYNAHRISTDTTSLYLSNLTLESSSSCSSIDDFMNKLQNIIRNTPCEEFYLCFTKEQMISMGYKFEAEEGEHFGYMLEGYSSHMYLSVHYENHTFHEPKIFETKTILPIFEHPISIRKDYIILPLYYLEKTHGYCVLVNCNEVAYTGAFQTWTTLLSFSVNSIYMRHELQQKAKTLELLYERDSMTGVYNRLGFKKYSQAMLRTCILHGSQMIVIFADMDGLKAINDQYGHEEGDIAICDFSNIIKETCIHGEIISRFGGDEIVIMGIDYSQDMASDFLNRLQSKLDQYNTEHPLYKLSVSAGYELYAPTKESDIEDCINKADENMYQVKKAHKKALAEDGILSVR